MIATSTGSNWACSSFDALLGAALALRGADVRFLLCDGVLPACQECNFQNIEPKKFAQKGPNPLLCADCFEPASKMLAGLGLHVFRYSEFLENSAYAKATTSTTNEKCEHALAGALRYFGVGNLEGQPFQNEILARYKQSTKLGEIVASNICAKFNFDVVILHHGIYSPQGALLKAFSELQKEIITWTPSYRKQTVLISHEKSYHHTLPAETTFDVEDWDDQKRTTILEYLNSRRTGENDWISFVEPNAKPVKLKNNAFEDGYRFGLFTNVLWDAQLHFESSAFTGLLDWLYETIKQFQINKKHQLIIRVHPAEITGTVPTRQPLVAEIQKRFGALPNNVVIIGPEEKISSYDLANQIDIALVYGTKMGIELACMGKTVIVAGDCWAKNKGFTYDVTSKDEYRRIISDPTAINPPSKSQIDRALKYAYYLFFDRMIKVNLLNPRNRLSPYSISNPTTDSLLGDEGLQKICNEVLRKHNPTTSKN